VSTPVIEAAIYNQLNAFATAASITIVYRNTKYTPVEGTSYIEEYILPNVPTQDGIGTQARNRYRGILQLTVVTPEDTGKADFNTLYNTLGSYFKRGVPVIHNGTTIQIERVAVGDDRGDSPWYKRNIDIYYRCDLDN